jgi:hypothetical protein
VYSTFSLVVSLRTMKRSNILAFTPVLLALFMHACGPKEIPKSKVENIQLFLKKVVEDYWDEDYRYHGMDIKASVTGLKIDKITEIETKMDNEYLVWGRVSYIIKGKRRWQDKEGNIVELEPEHEITHWFSCGVLEDKYLRELRKDNENRLTFYADYPIK